MKRTLYTLLAALAVTQAYAAPLNAEDWETIPGGEPPEGCFSFEDGKLFATSNTNGKELFYKVKEGTNLMENGSGLSITLQFNTADFLANNQSAFHIFFHNGNSDTDGAGNDFFHFIHVMSLDGELNIYDMSYEMDHYHKLSEDNAITTLTFNYSIKDNYLCYNYILNGEAGTEYAFTDKEVDSSLEWRPSFGLSHAETCVFVVTDVTFSAAPTIPEPATASLSLLALCGLAARRRRK